MSILSSIQSLFSKFLSNPLGTLNLPNIQIFQFSLVTIIVVIYILTRIILSALGRRYSTFRVFLGPFFMMLLVAYNYYFSYLASVTLNLGYILLAETLAVPLIIAVCIGLGYRIAKRDNVFLKKGEPHYRSSIGITLLWALSFLVKMGMATFVPEFLLAVGITFSVVLDITTGLIVGESFRIHRTYKQNFGGKKTATA